MTGDSIKDKILKLLALAESSNPHEAELATAQAERLMVKWGIETAELQDHEGAAVDDIVSVPREYKGAYAIVWVPFVNRIAFGLGNVRVLQSRDGFTSKRWAYVIGHKSDVERAEMLLNSLEIQAWSAMRAWWKNSEEREYLSDMDGYKARRQFIDSFAAAVQIRLKNMRREVVREFGTGTDLVLVSRSQKVDDFVESEYSPTKTRGRMEGSFFGRGAGHAAGQRASLGEKGIGGVRGELS